MGNFFTLKLGELLQDMPELDDREANWVYSDTDFWPNKDWHSQNWFSEMEKELSKLERRFSNNPHYQDLEADFDELFKKDREASVAELPDDPFAAF